MSAASFEALFRSANLAIRRFSGFSSDCCVVTFDRLNESHTLDRLGFGEAFFLSHGIDAIHVISCGNDWYQYPEMEQAMACVREATRGYGRVVTYGSGMGGYAAIRLAGLAGARCALAMSPQFSINPEFAPFEDRWQGYSASFRDVWEGRLPFPALEEAYVVYDPDDLDGRHTALLQSALPITPVALPQSGNSVFDYLTEIGLLPSLVLSVCAGTFEPAPLIEDAWCRREQSAQHLLVLAQRSEQPAERLALMKQAAEMAPGNAGIQSLLARELARPRRDVLFRSDNLVVYRCAAFSSACCVVTFEPFTDEPTLDRPGFGEEFFWSRRLDAIHVIPRDNDWYQYAEMEQAMAVVHAATRGYGRVVTYGSSMGGYAAIRLAGLVGADCALAMSPQYSIDRRIVRFEQRWSQWSARFKPVWERRLPFPNLREAYVVYDPLGLDGRHAALLARALAVTPVPLPESGHTVSGFLRQVGLLQSFVLAVCEGAADVPALIAEAWHRRQQSPQHFLARAEQTRRLEDRIALLKQAVRIGPADVSCLFQLAVELGRAKRHTESLACFERGLAVHRNHPGRLQMYSVALQHSGDIPAALAVMDEVAVLTEGAPRYEVRRRKLQAMMSGLHQGSPLRQVWQRWSGGRRPTVWPVVKERS